MTDSVNDTFVDMASDENSFQNKYTNMELGDANDSR